MYLIILQCWNSFRFVGGLLKWQGGPGHPTLVPLIRASRSGEHLARDGARWYTAARWGPHHVFSLSTECRSASGCHSAGRVCCHPVLHRSAGHRRALCGGSAALREGRLGRGLREGDGASSKIRTSARASDGGSGWGLRGWGFPRSAQGHRLSFGGRQTRCGAGRRPARGSPLAAGRASPPFPAAPFFRNAGDGNH